MPTFREVCRERWQQFLKWTATSDARLQAFAGARELFGFAGGLFLLWWLYRYHPVYFVPSTRFCVLVAIPGIVGLLYHFVSVNPRSRARQESVDRYRVFVDQHDAQWREEWQRRIKNTFGSTSSASPTQPSSNPLMAFDSISSYSAAAALWAAMILTAVFGVAAAIAELAQQDARDKAVAGFPLLIGQEEVNKPTGEVRGETPTAEEGTTTPRSTTPPATPATAGATPAGPLTNAATTRSAATTTGARQTARSGASATDPKKWKDSITANAINGFLFAALGAYISVLWRMMSRINANALTYRFMFTAALRSGIAMIIGLVAGQLDLFGFLKANGPREAVFFLTGVFTDWAIGSLRVRARDVFQRGEAGCDRLPLCLVDGLDEGVIDILDEIGIWDVQHLATVDPGELTMRTLYPFNRALDWIDQAILISSLRQNIRVARDLGIRGAIDLMALYGYTQKGPEGEPSAELKSKAEAVLKVLADKSGMDPNAIHILGAAFWFDYTVNLLYSMWQRIGNSELKGGSAVP